MVSHPDYGDRTLALRRPPSVSSRSSTAPRRHRHNRSHYGGSAYQPQNEFPVFAHTGDVEIVVASGRKQQRYLLHRLILAQCSGFFEAGTSQEWSRTQGTEGEQASSGPAATASALARIPEMAGEVGQRRRWRYELDWGDRGEEAVPMLVQKVSALGFGGGYHDATLLTDTRKPPRRFSAATTHRDRRRCAASPQRPRPASFGPWPTSLP